MKKPILITIVVIAGCVLFATSGVLDSLMLFLLAGVIPGTEYAIPSTFMLLIMTSIAWLLVFNLFVADMLRSKSASSKNRAKKQQPKQRFRRI